MTCSKIRWDGDKEHLTASENFSYNIEYDTQCGKYYTVIATCSWFSFDDSDCGFKYPTYTRTDLLIDGDWNALIQANEGFKVGVTFIVHPLYYYGHCNYLAKQFGWIISQFDKECNPLPLTYRWLGSTNGEAKAGAVIIREAITGVEPSKKLIISDSGNRYEYPINNPDSINLIPFPCGGGGNPPPDNCPPNTLDCGDCCLGCNEVFNQLSIINHSIRINL